jgi:biotin carboxylase
MITAAQELGYSVLTTGNQPDSLGHKVSDHYEFGDFSDRDAMLSLAQKHSVVGVIPSCNDFAAVSASFIAEQIGLPGHDTLDTAELLHHKDKFRDFCALESIPSPKSARSFDSVVEAASYIGTLNDRVIVKPIDLTGGKGVAVVERGEDPFDVLTNAYKISRAKRIVIEEFVEGSQHGYSALVVSGEVVFGFMDNEHYFANRYMVGAASSPSVLDDSIRAELATIVQNISKSLRLVDGIFHVQFIMTQNGPRIIEVCRRPPGDLYVNLVSLACGFDYPELIVKGFLGQRIDRPTVCNYPNPIVRYCVMSEKVGVLHAVSYSENLKTRIINQLQLWKPGQIVSDHLTTKYAILFLELDSAESLSEQVEHVSGHYDIHMEARV